MPPKSLAALSAAAAAFLLEAPPSVHRTAGVAVWFVVVDTVTGLLCARRGGGVTSEAFRRKLKDKLLCYAMLLGLAAGLSVLAESWTWLLAGWWGVMGAEGLSIAENLRGLLKRGGKHLAPVAQVLDRILSFLGAQANPAATAPTPPAPEPEQKGAQDASNDSGSTP